MKRANWTIARLTGAAVGAVFIYAGVMKAMRPDEFAKDVMSFQLVPQGVAAAMALYLPWLEMVAGGAMVHRRWARAGRWVIGALLLVFLVAIGAAWWRGLDITCGCFGPAVNKTNYPWLVARDVLLLVLLAVSAADNTDFPRGVAGGQDRR